MIRKCLNCDEEFNIPPSKIKKGYGKYCSNKCRIHCNGLPDNFFKKVKKDICWIWLGCKNPYGYGKITINYKYKSAHRFSWEHFNGNIPEGLHVLHKCDNPSCVNPDHLFLGTHKDNMKDMVKKNRNKYFKGVDHHKSKLTENDIIEIRNRISHGHSNKIIAIDFNVDPRTISHIKLKRTWKHI